MGEVLFGEACNVAVVVEVVVATVLSISMRSSQLVSEWIWSSFDLLEFLITDILGYASLACNFEGYVSGTLFELLEVDGKGKSGRGCSIRGGGLLNNELFARNFKLSKLNLGRYELTGLTSNDCREAAGWGWSLLPMPLRKTTEPLWLRSNALWIEGFGFNVFGFKARLAGVLTGFRLCHRARLFCSCRCWISADWMLKASTGKLGGIVKWKPELWFGTSGGGVQRWRGTEAVLVKSLKFSTQVETITLRSVEDGTTRSSVSSGSGKLRS